VLIEDGPFSGLKKNGYGALLADPPWHFQTWGEGSKRNVTSKYNTMQAPDMAALPVSELAAPDCVLFMWIVWPKLFEAVEVLSGWGFTYKTCAFAWLKGDASQIDMFRDDMDSRMCMGFWTRANSEVCLLATRGKPKRLSAGVRQGIIEPLREHSRKPDCVHGRIEKLVAGPYLELFARAPRKGWDVWGNETTKFSEAAE
jgi:N6-adenosine-specific RNA methylase IME4